MKEAKSVPYIFFLQISNVEDNKIFILHNRNPLVMLYFWKC